MTTEINAKQAHWQKLVGYLLGNQATWLANAGLKAGLFQAIAGAGETAISEEALAEQLGYKLRYVQVWCRSAYAFGLLDWDEPAGYRLDPALATLLLDPTDPQFAGGRIQFYTALYEDFLAFPDYLRSGDIWPRSAHDPWLLEALKNVTKPDSVMVTNHVLPQAPETLERLEAGGKILDIGCGGGYHLVHYARRFPKAQVIGLELDGPSVALARRTVAEVGLNRQIEIRHDDANELSEEDCYDLVTLNIALHETGGPAEYRNVLNRVYRALKPGGTIMICELPYPDSPQAYREQTAYQMLAGIQLHEALVGCGMITQSELRQLLETSRFANLRIASQPIPTRIVMLGEKGTRFR
jgi:ubiquinone/menaquinone biosynthesis C-methylase UbiE